MTNACVLCTYIYVTAPTHAQRIACGLSAYGNTMNDLKPENNSSHQTQDTPEPTRRAISDAGEKFVSVITSSMMDASDAAIAMHTRPPKPATTESKPHRSDLTKHAITTTHAWEKAEPELTLLLKTTPHNETTRASVLLLRHLETIHTASLSLPGVIPCAPCARPRTYAHPTTSDDTTLKVVDTADLRAWLAWGELHVPYLESTIVAHGFHRTLYGSWVKREEPTKPHRTSTHEQQRAMSNKTPDGPIDGLLSPTGEWVTDTTALHLLIKEKIARMYDTAWFPRIIQKILWKPRGINGLTRYTMRPTAESITLSSTAQESVRTLQQCVRNLIDSPTATNSREFTEAAKNIQLSIEPTLDHFLRSLSNNKNKTDNERLPDPELSPTMRKWLLARYEESHYITDLLTNYTERASLTLQPITASPELTLAINKTFRKLKTWKEVKAMFVALPRNKTSGPSGLCPEHITNAPKEFLEALLPILNEMIDGNFPSSTSLGAFCPVAKDSTRFRPIHLLDVLARGVDHRIASGFLDSIRDFKLCHPNQHGSVRGGNAPTAIDALLEIAEDAQYNNREAWLALLDCSEAFDSQTDAATDIALSSAGLPEQFILWARRSKHNQRRTIITAGGTSSPDDPVHVLGGSQGSSTMPPLWSIATRAILAFSEQMGAKGYTPWTPTTTPAAPTKKRKEQQPPRKAS